MIHEYSLPELFTAIESLHVFNEEYRLYLLRVTIEKTIEERNAYEDKKYYATFGQQSLFKNFYIEIISPSYEMSLRDAVLDLKNISMIYTETEFCAHVKAMFPNGKLCTLRYLKSKDRFVAEKGE